MIELRWVRRYENNEWKTKSFKVLQYRRQMLPQADAPWTEWCDVPTEEEKP